MPRVLWTLLRFVFLLPFLVARVAVRRLRGLTPRRWTFLFAMANEVVRWWIAAVLGRFATGAAPGNLPSPRLRGRLARDTQLEPTTLAGCNAEWHRPRGKDTKRCLLYLHGGGFVTGSIGTHRALMARLAQAAEARVVGIDYRLAPAHPFPAGLDDCVAAYRALLDSGEKPEHLFIGGDSAGGGLTLSTLLRLKAEGLPMPAGAVVLSPAVDLTDVRDSWHANFEVDYLGPIRDHVLALVPAYLGPEPDPMQPLASPIQGDLAGLPPLCIHVGQREVLRDQVLAFADKAKASGVPVELLVGEDMVHVWHAFAGLQPESDAAIAQLGAFLRARAPG